MPTLDSLLKIDKTLVKQASINCARAFEDDPLTRWMIPDPAKMANLRYAFEMHRACALQAAALLHIPRRLIAKEWSCGYRQMPKIHLWQPLRPVIHFCRCVVDGAISSWITEAHQCAASCAKNLHLPATAIWQCWLYPRSIKKRALQAHC